MEQLVVIVLVVVLVCVAGIGPERGGPVARVVGHVLLIAGGLTTGFFLSLLLELMLWPGAFVAIFGGVYTPPTPEQDRAAGMVFAVIVGGAGAVMPNLAFRLGYAAGALLVIQHGSDYWVSHGGGPLLLLGLGCWALVALGVWAIRWWLRPDPETEGASEPPNYWAQPPATPR
jgi:hypothetical protein